ncbi:MAG: antitoxin family protein [Chloroflexi bacterium]|nr:antitoxin family protein [Chloroflexota bacterium]
MARTIRASFENGVFTPLEPLTDIEEGALFVLNIEMATPNWEPEGTEHRSAPADDPKRLKKILAEMEVKDYLRSNNL